MKFFRNLLRMIKKNPRIRKQIMDQLNNKSGNRSMRRNIEYIKWIRIGWGGAEKGWGEGRWPARPRGLRQGRRLEMGQEKEWKWGWGRRWGGRQGRGGERGQGWGQEPSFKQARYKMLRFEILYSVKE